MSYPTDRILLFDRCDNPIGELSPQDVLRRVRVYEINGEHSLTVVTRRVIQEGTRALTVDGTGRWDEWVCSEPDETHVRGDSMEGTYRFVWSLQYDLQSVYGAELRPGIPNPVTAAVALAAALDGTARWTVGTVDVVTTGGLSMYDNSAWERLSDVLRVFGGEVDTNITVGPKGVLSRSLCLRAHLGSTSVTRRFDWSHDLTSIRRTPAPGPRFCRIIPRGKGEQVESSTGGVAYTRRINIKSVNGGIEYLRDTEAEAAFRVPDGSGGYEYPRTIVIYEDIEDPQELKDTALADMPNHTHPEVTYEADVMQFAAAGMDVAGISLGDDVQAVDRGFSEGSALRIQGRVVRTEIDDISKRTTVMIGRIANTLADSLMALESQMRSIASLTHVLEAGGTAAYLQNLLDRLNAEINATGGYSYLVPGHGLITYDVAVSDPLVGSEATKVVQIKGGSIRIADSKKPSFSGINDWEWKSVFVSGHVAAELVTAANIVTGYIGSLGDTFIDLDNHTVQLGQTVGSHVVVNDYGIEVFDNNGLSSFFAGTRNNKSVVRIGRDGNYGNVVLEGNGSVDIVRGDKLWCHFGYGNVEANYPSSSVIEPGIFYTLGSRPSNEVPGKFSFVEGVDCSAPSSYAHAIGYKTTALGQFSYTEGTNTQATGQNSHAEGSDSKATGNTSHAEGGATTASGWFSHAGGYKSTASGENSFAHGLSVSAIEDNQTVIGKYNVTSNDHLFIVGNGSINSRSNAFYVKWNGDIWCAGTLTQNSDRRLKKHHAYLSDDACDFIRKLKPALFTKEGERHVGFYAQDVQDAEPDGWDTVTVTPQHTDESLDFDPLTLDYSALIAPLVAYAQQLEKRVDKQQQAIESLVKRVEALEGK